MAPHISPPPAAAAAHHGCLCGRPCLVVARDSWKTHTYEPGTLIRVKIPRRVHSRKTSNPKGEGPYRVIHKMLGYQYYLGDTKFKDGKDEGIISASASHVHSYESKLEDIQASRMKFFQEKENGTEILSQETLRS